MRIDANRADWLQLTRTKVENIFSSHVCNLFYPLASKAAKKQTKLFTKKKNAMLDFLMVPLVVGIICAGIYGLFELFVRRKERLAIIEKIGENRDKLTFGIEIEYEGIISKFVDFFIKEKFPEWDSRKDLSLKFGGEIVSDILNDDIETWKKLKTVCMYLKKKNAITNKNAGGHIHVGAKIFQNNFFADSFHQYLLQC